MAVEREARGIRVFYLGNSEAERTPKIILYNLCSNITVAIPYRAVDITTSLILTPNVFCFRRLC